MSKPNWIHVTGSELNDACLGEYLDEVITANCSAIYLWKKTFNAALSDLYNSYDAIRLVERLMTAPNGVIQTRRLGHFLNLSGIEMRPQSLPEEKQQALHEWLARDKNRRWFLAYMRKLGTHTPALYVGETGDIINRIKDHIRAQTDFAKEITRYLNWSDLDFHYYDLGPPRSEDAPIRKSLEYITNAITIGGFTKRPG